MSLLKSFLNLFKRDASSSLFSILHEDRGRKIKGEIFYTLRHRDGEIEEGHFTNVVTLDASILAARLFANNTEPLYGVRALTVGSGDVGWDPMAPPAGTNTQRSLHTEIGRKGFVEVSFVDGAGSPSAIPTNVVDFVTTFSETEAVGPLVEMGLIGGDANTNLAIQNPILPAAGAYDATQDVRSLDTLCNYVTFPVINKPDTATLTFRWRLTF